MKLQLRPAATALVAAALIAGCGSGAPKQVEARATATPQLERIVSLSPTATETLFEIGAGPQVVAVDDQSSYPADAPRTKLSGFEPNVEAIAGYRPDLVVVADDTKNISAQLKALGIDTLVALPPETLDGAYEQVEQLGAATGHEAEAGELVDRMKKQIADLTGGLTKPARALSYYHELDDTLYSVTSKTFVGQIYALAGLRNVADPADKSGGGYPQLSAEYLVRSDPDLVFLADTKCCAQNAQTFAKRPGFARLKAVRNGQVVLLDDDVASRWGPRIVDLLAAVVKAVEAVPAT